MIIKLAQLAREKGSKAFFYTQLESGSEVFSYRQTHLAAAALAQELEKKGLGKDTRYIACNLFNGPEFVFLSFAVAYLGATLAVLNPRLSDEERLLRKVELENASNQNNITILTEEHIQRMIIDSLGIGIMELAHEPNGQIPVNPRTMEILSYAEKKEREFDPDPYRAHHVHLGLFWHPEGNAAFLAFAPRCSGGGDQGALQTRQRYMAARFTHVSYRWVRSHGAFARKRKPVLALPSLPAIAPAQRCLKFQGYAHLRGRQDLAGPARLRQRPYHRAV